MSNDNTDLISVSVNKRTTDEYTPPTQSANTLFRFFTKSDYLYNALEKKALIPRYYGENISYLDIGYHSISYPMICFCDITVHRLETHMELYGKYGIAFSKSWGIPKGIQPLQYVNKHSILRNDFTEAFSSAIENEAESPAANYLLTHMYFMKPIEGTMPRNDVEIPRNFTDECEWRFIPNVTSISLPQIVTEDDVASINVLNRTIEANECCWLNFDYSDIKYIIIPSQDEFNNLCEQLDKNIDDENTKRMIISKIILWSDAKEDF